MAALAKRTVIRAPDILTFPLWKEGMRALPTAFARSALFTVGSLKSPRKQCAGHQVASAAGVNMLFTGEELRQDDEDLFLALLHLMRGKAAGDAVTFMAHSMLLELGWSTGGLGYKRLKDTLDRMKRGEIRLLGTDGKKGFVGSLISSWGWDEGPDAGRGTTSSRAKIFVRFEPAILELFGRQPYSELQWAQRSSLASMMAKWLHTFFISQPATRAISLGELQALSGSQAGTRSFRQTLRSALDELKAQHIVSAWRLEAEYLWVTLANGEEMLRLVPESVLDTSSEPA